MATKRGPVYFQRSTISKNRIEIKIPADPTADVSNDESRTISLEEALNLREQLTSMIDSITGA